jgi:hypothetical protein
VGRERETRDSRTIEPVRTDPRLGERPSAGARRSGQRAAADRLHRRDQDRERQRTEQRERDRPGHRPEQPALDPIAVEPTTVWSCGFENSYAYALSIVNVPVMTSLLIGKLVCRLLPFIQPK